MPSKRKPPTSKKTLRNARTYPQFQFMSLPLEIRRLIYDFYLGISKESILRKRAEIEQLNSHHGLSLIANDLFAKKPRLSRHFAILAVSRQIFTEAATLFFGSNIFHHSINTFDSSWDLRQSIVNRDRANLEASQKAFRHPHFDFMKHISLDYISPFPCLGLKRSIGSDGSWMSWYRFVDFELCACLEGLIKWAPNLQSLRLAILLFHMPSWSSRAFNDTGTLNMTSQTTKQLKKLISRLLQFEYISFGYKEFLLWQLEGLVAEDVWEEEQCEQWPGATLHDQQATILQEAKRSFRRRKLMLPDESVKHIWKFTTRHGMLN